MAQWAPQKSDTLDALATEILHNYGRGRTIIAIDGPEGSGTSDFAAGLAAAIERTSHTAFVASIEDFHRDPASVEPEFDEAAFSRSDYDYSLLRRILLDPFKNPGHGGFVLAGYDRARRSPIEPKWLTAPVDAVLIVEGVFLNRPELRGLWSYSVWLEKRGLRAPDEYFTESKPRTTATAIVDNSDPEHPRRNFADSC